MRKNSTKWSITDILIIISVLIYILDKYIIASDGVSFGTSGAMSYILGLCGGGLLSQFGFYSGCVADGEPWRLVTHIFLHIFIVHIVVNMITLHIVGKKVEYYLGKITFLFYFFVIAILDISILSIFQKMANVVTLTAGASGAIFGLMGVLFAYALSEKIKLSDLFNKPTNIYLALYGILFTYTSGIWTILVHNMGFILGFLFEFIRRKITKIKKLNSI